LLIRGLFSSHSNKYW